jgi:hypothetical protein
MNDLVIVILNYNTKNLVLKCIKSILKISPHLKYHIWVVDNGSDDGSLEAFESLVQSNKLVRLIKNYKNVGYAQGNNIALKKLYKRYRYCLILNSDTEMLPNSIDKLYSYSVDNDYAISSCKLVNTDRSLQPNAGSIPYLIPMFLWISGLDDIINKFSFVSSFHIFNKKFYKGNKEVGWVSGSVMLIKSSLLNEIGFFDNKRFMYGEDVDFCWRARKAGYKIGWTEEGSIIHVGGASSSDPKYSQWFGEFRALIYLYNKYYGPFWGLIVKFIIYFFVSLRIMAFSILGKGSYAKTYAKIITEI